MGDAMTVDGNALLLSLLVGCVGLACFVYGKRQGRLPQMLAGLTFLFLFGKVRLPSERAATR